MSDPASSRTDARAERDARAHALAYPFAQPAHSFVFAGGAALELVELAGDDLAGAKVKEGGGVVALADYCRRLGLAPPAPWAARTPVIAHGSNASPARLARKFAGAGEALHVIPVLRAELADFDVVYAPHFSAYGSIPATLAASAGTAVELAITYLDSGQLAAMDATEIRAVGPTYARVRLAGIRARVEGGPVLDEAQVYLARRGALAFDGTPRALAARAAKGRQFEPLSQEQKQAAARDRLAPGVALDDFIAANLGDPGLRARRSEALSEWAVPSSIDDFEIVEG